MLLFLFSLFWNCYVRTGTRAVLLTACSFPLCLEGPAMYSGLFPKTWGHTVLGLSAFSFQRQSTQQVLRWLGHHGWREMWRLMALQTSVIWGICALWLQFLSLRLKGSGFQSLRNLQKHALQSTHFMFCNHCLSDRQNWIKKVKQGTLSIFRTPFMWILELKLIWGERTL